MHPSISNEVHRALKDQADKDAITVFAENVRKVLLGSPFGPRCVYWELILAFALVARSR